MLQFCFTMNLTVVQVVRLLIERVPLALLELQGQGLLERVPEMAGWMAVYFCGFDTAVVLPALAACPVQAHSGTITDEGLMWSFSPCHPPPPLPEMNEVIHCRS